MLTKSKKDGNNLFLSLLAYRTTPLNIGISPSQLLMSRRLRSDLPIRQSLLKPQVHNQQDIEHSMRNDKVKSKQNYDKRSRLATPLDKGDSVRVQLHSKTWTPAVVLKPHNDRSYLVKTPNGSVYRRNSKQIFRSTEKVLDDLKTPNFSILTPEHTMQEQVPDPKPDMSRIGLVEPNSMSDNLSCNQPTHTASKPVPSGQPYVTRLEELLNLKKS